MRITYKTCSEYQFPNYSLWLYLIPLFDLLVTFYESEENYFLKIVSNILVLFTLSCITVHYIIHFTNIKRLVRIMIMFDILRFSLYLVYSFIDGYFYKSGIKEHYKVGN